MWNPGQYLRFCDLRTRPALDLIARIPPTAAAAVWDLGCGTGAITQILAGIWPAAVTYGLDNSPEMLASVEGSAKVTCVQGKIEDWSPDHPADVIFSNAALHWVEDHASLFPRLMDSLAESGVLAVQMPRNHGEPSHRVLYDLARSSQWADRVEDLVVERPVADPAVYHDLLADHATRLEVWETIYHQALAGADAVAQWTKGSVLRPYLERLGSAADVFFATYADALRDHYPRRTDGTTLFPFRRLFIVARR